MQLLARQQKAKLLVFKELSDRNAAMKLALEDLGYIRGSIPPMHRGAAFVAEHFTDDPLKMPALDRHFRFR